MRFAYASRAMRSYRLALFLLAAVLTLGAGPARGDEAPPPPPELPSVLRLNDALEILRTRGLDLLIAEATVRSAQGDVHVAGAIQNPAVSFGIGGSFACGGQCSGGQGVLLQIGLTDQAAIENTFSRKRALKVRVAEAALAAARMTRADALRTLEFQVKQQVLQILLTREALRFAREVLASNVKTFELNARKYQVGAINEADLAKVETAKLEAEQAVDTAEQNLRSAKVALAFLLGVRRAVPEFDVDEPALLRSGMPPRLATTSTSALLEQAFTNRPDLKAVGYNRQRAEASVALARRLRFPDVTLGVTYNQEGSGSGSVTPPTITFSISAAIPVFYRQRGEIMKAEADRRTQTLQQAKLQAQIVADVETAFATFRGASSLVKRMEDRLLDRAKRARDLVEVQWTKGAASLLELLDAQRTYVATNVEYRQNLTAYWTAVFQLEQALGAELR
jgi:cobalt-zinc-cadmium efflux system outer membrane protein